jgi:hypothetical protein
MAYVDIYTAATAEDAVLRKQVAVGFFKAAVDIINEDPATANHYNRLAWARRVTDSNSGPMTEAARWIWKVLENVTIQAAPNEATDNDVQFVINSIIGYIVQQ